ncbi:hypothetical protein SSX86_005665 [Deinandra increscens subsp. villosa]|uniref:BZIP domain-containing protein n=1 Tax=Deinandra increscens subsp. villosa TaxID=3103831 RepID=A0AAP0DQG9_9ASTR
MASSNTGSDEDLQRLIDLRTKRMVSNRESARRSRMRKQKHLDDLVTQLSQLRKQNNQVRADVSITMQHYMNVESENSVLRAQVVELSHRLESLNQIMEFMGQSFGSGGGFVEEPYYGVDTELIDEFMNNSLSCVYANKSILASSDMIPY